jgi:signal transduction histidine kinase
VENFPHNYKIVLNKIATYLHGEKKLYVFLTAIFFVVFAIGFFSPSLLQSKKENWNFTLQKKLENIQKTSLALFADKQSSVIKTSKELKALSVENKHLTPLLFQQILCSGKFSEFQIFLMDSTKTEVASNATIGIDGKDIFGSENKLGVTYFHSSPLLTLLYYVDELTIRHRKYFLLTTKILETNYASQNISPEKNFSTKLETTFESEVEVFYSPSKAKSLDGRYFSFDLPNNYGQKIGLVTVAKPTLKAELKIFRENTSRAQSLFIIIGVILLGFILRHETRHLNQPLLKWILVILFLVFLRWLLFALNFPASYLTGELTNPNYFSSAFGEGIVKSPLEFLITSFFFGIIVFFIYYSSKKRMDTFFTKKSFPLLLRLGLGLTSLFIILLSIRGLSAAIKSVVFDSSLRYFETADLIPGIPHLVMHIATFLVTLSGFVLIQFLLKVFYSCLPTQNTNRANILLFFLTIFPSAALFVLLQKQPLVSVWLFIFIMILLSVVFFINELTEPKALKKFLFFSFAASVMTISLMNFFNAELEKEELKRTALFLSRPQESYLNFLLNESLSKIVQQENSNNFFSSAGANYSSLALNLWLQSSLRDEKVLSSITLLDKKKKILGYFSNGVQKEQLVPQIALAALTKNLQIFDVSDKSKQWQKIFCGIIPITERDQVIGFAAATIIFTAKSALSVNATAGIFQQSELNLRYLSEKNFNVFLLAEDKIYIVSGNVFPSEREAARLFTLLSKEKEGWVNYERASENLLGFGIQRMSAGSHPFLIVAQKETAFSFSLFNFFKLFIVHTSFLLIVLLFLFIIQLKGRFNLTFRSQLLFAFLIIAILPIIALAVYNRNSVEEKNISLIHNALKEKVNLAENYFKAQTNNTNNKDLQKVFQESTKNLLLSFSVYENSQLLYSSEQNLFEVSLLRKNISSLIQTNQSQPGNGFFINHFIGSREVLSYFRTVSLNNHEFLLEVNDYFNQIPVALNFVELNVFLFGVYSFAIVLIVIVSSLLADQISSPIRRLTRATRAVAHGDLNVMLAENSMGEIKELLNGFNIMTEELRKNQHELAELEREQAWKEMARQVAHEIKNPLTPMKLTLQQLVAMYKAKSKNFDTLFEKVSETILAQIETLSQIASEFSNFAKMPSIKLSEIDLKKSLNEIILLFNDENISLHLLYAAGTEIIKADASQLKRMFINLIRNAIQAEADNVLFSVDEDEKYLLVRISDNGKGISDEAIHKIFSSNFTTKFGGMGLGLKLAKKFIENINGNISVEQTSSKGTTFLIQFLKETRSNNAAS